MIFLSRILVLFFALLLQTTLVNYIAFYNIVPNLVLITMVLLSFHMVGATGITIAFFSGLALDAYSPESFGANAFTLTLITFLIGKLTQKIIIDNIFFKSILIILAISIHYIIFYFFASKNALYDFPSVFLLSGLPSIIYSSVIAVTLSFIINLNQ